MSTRILNRPGKRVMRDSSTLRNPHARPRTQRAAKPILALPPIEYRPSEYAGVRLVHERGEGFGYDAQGRPIGWDKLGVWELTYRCEYDSGRVDVDVDCRRVIAVTRAKALLILQGLLAGFTVARILLYHVAGPMTPDQIRACQARNAELAEERKHRNHEGHEGHEG